MRPSAAKSSSLSCPARRTCSRNQARWRKSRGSRPSGSAAILAGRGRETSTMMRFRDRKDAGQQLAGRLEHYRARGDVIVLALPRGGVPVAFEVSKALHVPLDVFIVRKLGLPGQPEYAMGAIASGGVRVMNPDVAALQ